MTEQNILKLAKQGNSKALAAIINQSLKPKNVTAKVGLKEGCLQILLEASQLPNQQEMVSFIRKGLTKLGVESIDIVKVYGRQLGEESPGWSQTFEMISQPENASMPEQIDVPDFPNSHTDELSESILSNVQIPRTTRQADRPNLSTSATSANSTSSRQAIGPLSVGNVVSTALVLYRSHLKTYLQLALKAHLWVLVPVYGWAKYIAISGMISRLAFNELTSQPESVKSAENYTKPRLWSFFRVAFQVSLMLLGIYIGLSIVFYIAIFLAGLSLVLVLNNVLGNSIITTIIIAVLGILAFVCFISALLWFISRWFVAEVPLAVEESINGKESINRSWKLTKNSVRRIQGVVLVAFLVTLPFVSLTSYLPQIFLIQLEEGSSLFYFVYFVSFLTSLAGGILVLPFWQALKAVLYYDLRSRREGMGLRLRDSK